MAPLSFGIVQRALPGETACGDQYALIEDATGFLAAVVDGLGHGEDAYQAATRAVAWVRSHPDASPEAVLVACHAELRDMRGAAMAVVRVDLAARTLTHAAIGNVEVRLVTPAKVLHPLPTYGIVGAGPGRKVKTETLPWPDGAMLVMHTDGVDDRFPLQPAHRHRQPQDLADALIASHGRDTDDQLLLVVREEPS